MANKPGKYNITIIEGATFDLTLTWKNPDDSPVDLTGYTARLQVRPNAKDTGTPLLEMTTENGRITLGDELGTIQLQLSAATVTNLAWKSGAYDLEMVSGVIVTRLLEGKVTVSQEVTK